MNITSITVGLTRTESLPGYSNIRPSLSLTAQIEPGEDWAYTRAQLTDEVKSWIENYVDIELEQAGQPAKFSEDPRYDLIYWRQANLAFIINSGTKLEGMPGTWFYPTDAVSSAIYTGQRLPALRALVDKLGIVGSEFGSGESLQTWAWAYLDLPVTYSIIRIQAHVADDSDWHLLGRAIVPGDVYAFMRNDDDLLIELHRGTGVVGLYGDVQKTADEMSHTPTATLRTLDEVGNWIQARLAEETYKVYWMQARLAEETYKDYPQDSNPF